MKLFMATALSAASALRAGPCDICESGGTPCVAAHSMVRALYASFHGALYRVRCSTDNATLDVRVAAGGIADGAAHAAFCTSATNCTVAVIYDQSPHGNQKNARSSSIAQWLAGNDGSRP